MSGYEAPPWAVKPSVSSGWKLIEIKSGVQVNAYILDQQPCTLLGRAADQVDVVLSHESCSRWHARIAFDAVSENPWLRDLASAHGTIINKQKLPAIACGKTESRATTPGARGVLLYPGDVLQFGASSRIFCVEGPENCSRNSALNKLHRSQRTKPPKDTDDPSSLSSIRVNEHRPGEQDHSPTSHEGPPTTLDLEGPPPATHRADWDRLRAIQYKLDNLQQESERIRAKIDLTDGQTRQLERNESRERQLRGDFATLESELIPKLFPSAKPSATKLSAEAQEFLREDEVDDRTRDIMDNGDLELDPTGETEQSLTKKWKTMVLLLQANVTDSTRARQRLSLVEEKLSRLLEAGDEESFFVQNDAKIAKESVDKLESESQHISKSMLEVKRLLHVVNPKLYTDETTGYIGTRTQTRLPPPKTDESDISSFLEDESFVMPPPALPQSSPPPQTNVDSSPAIHERREIEDGTLTTMLLPPPPAKKTRVVGPSMPAPYARSKVAPPLGTLAMLSAATSNHAVVAKSRSRGQSKEKSEKDSAIRKAASMEDGNIDVWQAPKDQDGSGRTKLNAKFAGRY